MGRWGKNRQGLAGNEGRASGARFSERVEILVSSRSRSRQCACVQVGQQSRRMPMLFEGGLTFTNFLVDLFAVFVFVVWFWLLIVVFMELFRRHDISGWVKAIWVIALIAFSYLGVLA